MSRGEINTFPRIGREIGQLVALVRIMDVYPASPGT